MLYALIGYDFLLAFELKMLSDYDKELNQKINKEEY